MYNPFKKAIGSDLNEDDLNDLVTNKVSEGFFVEYKESFPSTAKTANGIAALANTYGGWFIVGIKSNAQNEAAEVCGIDIKNCSDPASFIRNAIRDNLDPYPVFRHNIVKLGNGKIVSVTWIPPSDETPHVAKDGRVYVRKGDAKEPVRVETKYQLETVSERGKKSKADFNRFSQVDDSVIEKGNPGIQLSLSPRPSTEFEGPIFWTSSDFEKLKAIVEQQLPADIFEEMDGVTATTNIPFTTFYRSGGRIVIEHGEPSQSWTNLFVEIDGRGQCRIFLPIHVRRMEEVMSDENISPGLYAFISEKEYEESYPLYFSSASVVNALMYLCRLYLILIGDERAPGGFRYVMEAVNLDGCVPYADDKDWLDHVGKFGLPILKKKRLKVPFHDEGSVVAEDDADLIENVRYTLMSMIGLPADLTIKTFISTMMAQSEAAKTALKEENS